MQCGNWVKEIILPKSLPFKETNILTCRYTHMCVHLYILVSSIISRGINYKEGIHLLLLKV